jgi:hypothetical protein
MTEGKPKLAWQAWQVDEDGEKVRLLAEADAREDLQNKLGRKLTHVLYRLYHHDRPVEGWKAVR